MTDASEGDFRPFFPQGISTIAIVGVGLMGGSLARAIRARWPGLTIVGVDRPEVIAEAREAGAIDRDTSGAAAGRAADLVLLAAPVLQNIACLEAMAAAADPSRRILVSDLGSTKQAIVEAARSLPPHVTFIGGHPMAGAARGGFAAARADLFHGRPWILTPDTDTDTAAPATEDAPAANAAGNARSARASDALQTLQAFVRALGGEPVVMRPADHDRVMAYVSHLPQLVASGLMRVIGPRVGAAGLSVSGPGLADTTRLASSPSGVWRDICQTNAIPIGAALEAFIAELEQVRQQLETPDAIAAWLDEGARWRGRMPNGEPHGGPGGGPNSDPSGGRSGGSPSDDRVD